VVTNAAGEIFVAERHGSGGRILKFTKDGTFIKAWGEAGSGPGQFNIPHSLAIDSQGRLFVADRGNVRIQIFDQEGKFIDEWYQFSRLSGIYIDRNDMVYGADSESSPTSNPGGWRRGIRIGSAKDGKLRSFIPDPEHTDPKNSAPGGTSAAEGVAVDAAGNVYGAEVGPRAVKKYARR
jgi:sugar lactone lactonase YvrE